MGNRVIPCTDMAEAVLDESSGMRNAYRQLFELGRGGMARVYLAESLAFGLRKIVVLKVLNPELCADPEMRASFRREAELSAQMNHPNVVQVMAVVEYSNSPVIVMEYLDGEPLSVLLKQAGQQFPLRLHMFALSQVLAGLHHFHELRDLDGSPLNAVHRDVSPQNVMVLHDGPVKVLDFGIAKINAQNYQTTRTGLVKGKIPYMPPEQLLGGASVDRRADIFAVGVMLWEAVADRRMWEGKTELELLRSLATGSLPNLRDFAPNVPDSVLRVVQRATSADREMRFASALEMQLAIERALTQEGWVVQPRDLADFMSRQFGESRRARDRKLQSALRSMRGTDLVADGGSAPSIRMTPAPAGESGNPTVRTAGQDLSSVSGFGHRYWHWVLAAVGCLALIVALTFVRTTPSQGPTAEQLPSKMVTFEVDVLPSGTEIMLGGRALGKDHYQGQQPSSDKQLTLEVRAPGYMSKKKEVTLNKNLSLQMVLEPEPALSNPVASEPSAAASAARVVGSTTRVRAQRRSASSSALKRPNSAKSSRQCTPPYTFGADGVKTYKPECF